MKKIQVLLLMVSVLLTTSFSPDGKDSEMFYATHVQETTFEGVNVLDAEPVKSEASFELFLDDEILIHYHGTGQKDVYELTLMPEEYVVGSDKIHYLVYRGRNVDNLFQRFIALEVFPLDLGVNAISIINTVGEIHTRYTISNAKRDYFLKKE
ncbi:MAG: hypothetical protein ACOCYD_02135 [bacterium]